MLTQDVGSDVEGRHAIPIARLAGNQLQVVVFLDRLGEPFNARPRIGRACLTFNLSDFSTVGIELVEEFRRFFWKLLAGRGLERCVARHPSVNPSGRMALTFGASRLFRIAYVR